MINKGIVVPGLSKTCMTFLTIDVVFNSHPLPKDVSWSFHSGRLDNTQDHVRLTIYIFILYKTM